MFSLEMIVIIIVLILLVAFLVPAISLAPYVPMWSKDLPRLMDVMNLQPGETMVDLGCGDGKVVLYAAEHQPKANAVGIELALPMYLICRLRNALRRNTNTSFHLANALKADLSQYDVIYLYSLPEKIKEHLIEKLRKEMKPNARIISYAFTIAGLEPTVKNKPNKKDLPIYEYKLDQLRNA